MAQPDRGPRMPATLDEEIIAAQEQGVVSTLTDGAQFLAHVKQLLEAPLSLAL